MKKLISFVFALILFSNILGQTVLAQSGVGFYESMENLQKLKSYSMNQMVSGAFDAQTDDGGRSATGNFSLSMKSDIVNQEAYKPDAKMQITAKVHIDLTGEGNPFDSIDVMARLSIISLPKEGTYIRLEGVDVNALGLPESDVADYESFKAQLDEQIQPIKWQWIFIPLDYFKGQLDENMPSEVKDLVDEDAIRKKFKDQGFQKGLRQMIDEWINIMEEDGSMSEADASQARLLLDRFFKTEFFTIKNINRAGREPTTTFSFNKKSLTEFIKGMSKELDEELTDEDLAVFKSVLNKFQLSGSYHENTEHRIFDRFNLRIGVNNLEELKKLQINATYKIGNINKDQKIVKPAKSMTIDETDLDFLPQAEDSNNPDEIDEEVRGQQ